MYNPNFRRNRRILILFLLTTTLSLLTYSQIMWTVNNFITKEKSHTDFESVDWLITSDYVSDFGSVGEDMDITLHQSYLNTSFDTTVNTSIVNGNNFTLPSPKDTFFNSSFTRFDIGDIYAPNKTLTIEDESGGWITLSANHYTSFRVPTSCYLTNLSIELYSPGGADIFYFDVFGAQDNSGIPKFDTNKDLTGLGPRLGQHTNDSSSPVWYTLTGLDQFLNTSDTYDNYFFIKVSTENGLGRWRIEDETNGDDTYSYDSSSLIIGADFTLKVGLRPIGNNVANASDINLQINNEAVSDITDGSGYWESSEVNGSASGALEYNVTADWWDVECNIAQVLINYTRTDLKANSEFFIAGSGQIVNWNVTRGGGLNYFDTRLANYQINFTIPEAWNNPSIRVFNGESDERTSSVNKRLLGNGYREINVPNAGNGTFWFLNATSANLVSSIDSYIGLSSADLFNFTDVAHFNATFSKYINDGTINLSIYSPVLINDELNYTVQTQSFTAGTEISIIDWDISNDVTQYGNFRVHIYWNNYTEAGFLEEIITILGETSLTPTLPDSTFDASDVFVIDIFFNDIGLGAGISGASITHSLNGGAPKGAFTDYANGTYSITIDCNDPDFSAYGPNLIEINATKDFYNNQSETVEITILGETELIDTIPRYSFDSTENFDVALFFNNTVKDLGVDGATIEAYVNSTLYNDAVITPLGGGNYNVTVDCDDDAFFNRDYGPINLSINIEKAYYYNHSVDYIITITGETSLSTSKFPVPSVGYYNSDETFNITADFVDIGRIGGISGGQAKVYVKPFSGGSYQEYSTTIFEFGVGSYNITIDCSDALFNPYGKYNIKVNITKLNFYLAEDILEEIVVGNTTLTILDPTGTITYDEDEVFDIIIEYEDHTIASGITGADISYTLNGTGYRSDNYIDNLDGTYTITINVDDSDFGSNYGNVNIIIWANKTNYINLTQTFIFERRILTNIAPSNTPALIEEIRGNSIFYTFNYSDRLGNPIDTYNDFENTTSLQNFGWNLVNDGNGNYTLELNTSLVLVIPTPYTLNFSIYTFGKQSQEISFTIIITVIQTRIEIDSWNDYADFARSTEINVSIDFYFNDTTNLQAITGLSAGDIFVNNFDTGTAWAPGFELFNRVGNGNYTLNISTIGMDSGFYTLELNISKFPNYNWSLAQIQFSLRGNYTQIHLISISDPGGQLTPVGLYNFTIFEGSDITTVFNLTDLEYGNSLVIGAADSYSIWYENLLSGDNGTLTHSLIFDLNFDYHVGDIDTSNTALIPGNYLINITITKSNYESTFFVFNLTVIARYQVRLNITAPTEVDAGGVFSIVVKAEYLNGSIWLPLTGTNIIHLTPFFNDLASTIQIQSTNSTGEALFQITVRSDARTMNLTIQLDSEYYHLGDVLTVSNIDVNPLPAGLSLKDLIPYLIIIGAALALVGGSIGVYRGVIVPKKREKSRILKEVKTIFDDAINLEHILVLYKGTGTCVYFKSFGSEEIDPELISGFITAICSFGKDLVCQEELNEISYGDKMLLLSDGEYIRVALVLSKKASIILRKNLMEFITEFETIYTNELPNWRGQLNVFRNSGALIDEVLNTSIILPHEISYEFSNVKALKNPHSKDVLKVANNLMKASERKFLFIATLLKEATDKTSKDTAEIFMGIKELRDKKMMIPIEISAIGAQPISQQEMALINQRVASLVNLSQEERQKLVEDLSQMSPAEREAYFASLGEHEIVSAPIEEKPGTAIIDNVKVARKEIKNLKKIAKTSKKEKDYEKTINIYQNAIKIAVNWELIGESEELEELIRQTKIEDLKIKMISLEKEAKLAAKKEKYNEASQKYKISSKIASEIFKLGVTDMTKEVKRLSNKSKEYEKLI